MELVLDRRLSEKRIFPAIDINKSGTRREEYLLTHDELDALYYIRKTMSSTGAQEFNEMMTDELLKRRTNEEFVRFINNFNAKSASAQQPKTSYNSYATGKHNNPNN
jgi:transcription termination factor Rho